MAGSEETKVESNEEMKEDLKDEETQGDDLETKETQGDDLETKETQGDDLETKETQGDLKTAIVDLNSSEPDKQLLYTGLYELGLQELESTVDEKDAEKWIKDLGLTKLTGVTIESKIGEGAFGEVHKGYHEGRPVAVKAVRLDSKLGLSKAEIQEALAWELAQMARARSPNIVHFKGVALVDSMPRAVMEFCEHGELLKILKKKAEEKAGPFPLGCLTRWGLEIAMGIMNLHAQGIVHRDLKPENVLIDGKFRAKLADLGVAGADSLLEDKQAYAVERGLQDLRYISPQKLENLKSYQSTMKDDVYAYGLVLWQILNGGSNPSMPVKNPDLAIDMKQGNREKILESWPKPLQNILRKCWQFDPDKRPTASELVDELKMIVKGIHPNPNLLRILLKSELDLFTLQSNHGGCRFVPLKVREEETKTQLGPTRNFDEALREFVDDSSTRALLLFGLPGAGKSLATTYIAEGLLKASWAALSRAEMGQSTTAISQGESKKSERKEGIQILADETPEQKEGYEEYGVAVKKESSDEKKKTANPKTKKSNESKQNRNDETKDTYFKARGVWTPIFLREQLVKWSQNELKGGIEKAIRNICGFDAKESVEGLKKFKFLIIADGLDELEREESAKDNIPNMLGLSNWPNVKILMTCRSYTPNERIVISLGESYGGPGKRLSCYHILPFNNSQIVNRIQESLHLTASEVAKLPVLRTHGLKEVLSCPQVLSLFLRAWDVLQIRNITHMRRWTVYECYLEACLKDIKTALPPNMNVDVEEEFCAFAFTVAERAVGESVIRRDISLPPVREMRADSGKEWLTIKERVASFCEKLYDSKRASETGEGGERAILSKEKYRVIMLERLESALTTLPLIKIRNKWRFTHHSLWAFFLIRGLALKAKKWCPVATYLSALQTHGRDSFMTKAAEQRLQTPRYGRVNEDSPLDSPAVQGDLMFLELLREAVHSSNSKAGCFRIGERLGLKLFLTEDSNNAPIKLFYPRSLISVKIMARPVVNLLASQLMHTEAILRAQAARAARGRATPGRNVVGSRRGGRKRVGQDHQEMLRRMKENQRVMWLRMHWNRK